MSKETVVKLQDRKYVEDLMEQCEGGAVYPRDRGITTHVFMEALLAMHTKLEDKIGAAVCFRKGIEQCAVEVRNNQESLIRERDVAKDAARATFTGQQDKIDSLELKVRLLQKKATGSVDTGVECVRLATHEDNKKLRENAVALQEQHDILQAQYDDLSASVNDVVQNFLDSTVQWAIQLEKEKDALREQLTEPTAAAEGSELEQARATIQLLEHRISVIDEKKQEQIAALKKENAELTNKVGRQELILRELRTAAEANANNEVFRKDEHRGSSKFSPDVPDPSIEASENVPLRKGLDPCSSTRRVKKDRPERAGVVMNGLYYSTVKLSSEEMRVAGLTYRHRAREYVYEMEAAGACPVTMKINADKKSEVARWWKNGDHPQDDSECNPKEGPVNEGKVVRYYRHPNVSGTRICEKCGWIMHDHGWIDNGGSGFTVCPGDWIVNSRHGYFPVKEKPLED